MIHSYGTPDPPVPRLLGALAARGYAIGGAAGVAADSAATLILGPGVPLDELALGVLLGAWRRAKQARVLVLSLIGAHPDARAERLRQLWRIEEWARSTALPVLTLRLAPLLGAQSPLWIKLRSRPRLPRTGQRPLNPVDEADVIETLTRALEGRARWEGWYEVAGPEPLSLQDLARLAREPGPLSGPASGPLSGPASGPLSGPASGRGDWEPPLAELEEHRLSECEPWARHFKLTPGVITARAREWPR